MSRQKTTSRKDAAPAATTPPPNPLETAKFQPRESLESELTGPLFNSEEQETWTKRFKDWERAYKDEKAKWSDREALERERLHETRKRVAARPHAFTNALLVIVGTRGRYIDFAAAFEHSRNPELTAEMAKYDTPENRRALHTLLRALEEVPKSWARSAFVRFLRDQGKQKQAKYDYTGKGMFGKDYGWKGDEIIAVCELLMGGRYSAYSDMLITYADIADEIYKDDSALERPGSYLATFAGVRTERNRKLIDQVCGILEQRGLAPLPEAAVREPKGPRTPKVFTPGTIIRRGTLRDLPLPALVKVPIEKSTDGRKGEWTPGHVEWVITELRDNGYAICYRAAPAAGKAGSRVAYGGDRLWNRESKEFLYGAEYLGPWTGKLDSKNELKYKFLYRRPGAHY